MKRQKNSEIDIQNENGGKDRLSDLPDHVLLHIIGFMNTKYFVQTCVLSKRWKDLWKSLTNLKLHQYYILDHKDIFNKYVSHILFGRENSLPLHSLTYWSIDPSKTAVSDIMKYAASHNVQQLTVNVDLLFTQEDFEIPPSIFNCRSLTYLKLDFGDRYGYFTRSKNMLPKSLDLPALKTLHLICLTFTSSNNDCAEPFSRCNMLITLIIMGCILQDDTKALCITNSKITSLTLADTNNPEKAHKYKVVFCTPKLTSLTIIGRPIFLAPSACNSPFIEEINADFSFPSIPYEGSVMLSWLQLLFNVKILTLGFDTLEGILAFPKNNGSWKTQPSSFVRLKSLKVILRCDLKISIDEVRGMINYLLQNSLQTKVDIIKQPCSRGGLLRPCCYARRRRASLLL